MKTIYLQGIKNAFFSPIQEARRTMILSPYRYRTVTWRKGLLSGPSFKLGMVFLGLDCLGVSGQDDRNFKKGHTVAKFCEAF